MAAIAIVAAVAGGYVFAVFVAAGATAMYYEWMRIVRGWSFGWKVGGFVYCLLPALGQFLRRAVAAVGGAVLHELRDRLGVAR